MFRNRARPLAAGALAVSLLAAPSACAEEILDSPRQTSDSARRWKKRWIASWLAVAAVNGLDVQSSRGRVETNPLLRDGTGHFAPGKAALLKLAVGGGFLGTQLLLMRSHPEKNHYKPFTIANTAVAGALASVVAHNDSLPPLRRADR